MREYIAFTKKEFMEVARNYKLLIMGIVFLILGLMNPLTAKIMPELLESFMPKGMTMTVIEPTALDSWIQFYKNVPQMGLIILVILFSGLMANELFKGTLINMLTKGLKRKTVVLSKFTMASIVWTGSYLLCFLVSYVYTLYFWRNDNVNNIFFAAMCLWLFGILLISVLTLGSIFSKSSYVNLLFTGGFVIVLLILNIVPKIAKYNPLMLATSNMNLLNNKLLISDFTVVIVETIILIIAFIFMAIKVFDKKKI